MLCWELLSKYVCMYNIRTFNNAERTWCRRYAHYVGQEVKKSLLWSPADPIHGALPTKSQREVNNIFIAIMECNKFSTIIDTFNRKQDSCYNDERFCGSGLWSSEMPLASRLDITSQLFFVIKVCKYKYTKKGFPLIRDCGGWWKIKICMLRKYIYVCRH